MKIIDHKFLGWLSSIPYEVTMKHEKLELDMSPTIIIINLVVLMGTFIRLVGITNNVDW